MQPFFCLDKLELQIFMEGLLLPSITNTQSFQSAPCSGVETQTRFNSFETLELSRIFVRNPAEALNPLRKVKVSLGHWLVRRGKKQQRKIQTVQKWVHAI